MVGLVFFNPYLLDRHSEMFMDGITGCLGFASVTQKRGNRVGWGWAGSVKVGWGYVRSLYSSTFMCAQNAP